MTNLYCQDLALPFTLDSSVLTTLQASYNPAQFAHYNIDHARDPSVELFLRGLGLRVAHSEVFYTPPGYQLPIHIDGGTEGSNLVKLNWVYGGAGSSMTWYEPSGSEHIEPRTTTIGTPYLTVPNEHARLVHSHTIGLPTVVNAGLFHSVVNGPEGRWCVSYVVADSESGAFISWATALERFSGYFQ